MSFSLLLFYFYFIYNDYFEENYLEACVKSGEVLSRGPQWNVLFQCSLWETVACNLHTRGYIQYYSANGDEELKNFGDNTE